MTDNSSNNRELIVADQHVEDVGSTAIAAYQNRDVIRELAARLMMFHPAADEIGQAGMIQVAQLAVLMGASPLPNVNEIHAYPDSKGRPIVQPGINYWQRRAIHYGGVRWIVPVRPVTIDEIELYQIEGSMLGAICIGTREREFQTRVDANHKMGIDESTSEIKASIQLIGLGVVGRKQYTYNNEQHYTEAKTGRPLIWTAMKRAETDFYKRAFPFIPGERIPAGLGMEQIADGSFQPTYDRNWRELNDGVNGDAADPVIVPEPTGDPAANQQRVNEINHELGLTDQLEQQPMEPAADVETPSVVIAASEPVVIDPVGEFDPADLVDIPPTNNPVVIPTIGAQLSQMEGERIDRAIMGDDPLFDPDAEQPGLFDETEPGSADDPNG